MGEYAPVEIPDDWGPRDVETKILQLTNLLDVNTRAIKERHEAYIAADYEFQIASAQAFINIEAPTVKEREARAMLATASEYHARKAAEHMLKSAKDAGHNIRQALYSLDNVLKNYTSAERHARGVGR